MTKMEKFYESLIGREITTADGEIGYLVTVGDLIDNGGKQEFFKVCRRQTPEGIKVSRDVYRGLEYDRSDRTWWADTYTGACGYGIGLERYMKVFIGFTF